MTTATRRPAVRRTLAAAATLTVLVLAGACSSAGGDSDDSGGGSTERSVAEQAAPAPADLAAGDSAAQESVAQDGPAQGSVAAAPAVAASAEEQKVIANGAVQLRSDDVAKAVFDVRNVLDTYAGEVEASETQTDDEGEPLRAHLTLRVPTRQFDEAMQDLAKVGVLVSSSGNTQDVTGEVLDNDVRVDVQRRSIDRISLLLEQATSIRDVVAIEAQLSQRQADLASLEKQQRYYDDQTSMATINVSVERTKEKRKPAPAVAKDDDSGFVAGLTTGWDALTTFGVGLATVVGALLPWMVVAAIVAIVVLPLVRRYRRKNPTPTPAA